MRTLRSVMDQRPAVGLTKDWDQEEESIRGQDKCSPDLTLTLPICVVSALYLSACWLNFPLSLKISMTQNGHPTMEASVKESVSPQARQLKNCLQFWNLISRAWFQIPKETQNWPGSVGGLPLVQSAVAKAEELCANTVGGGAVTVKLSGEKAVNWADALKCLS